MKRITISIALLACLVASPAAQSVSGATAYYADYNVTNNNYDYYALPVYCASVDGDKPLEWRSKYGWTGYCGETGPQDEEACGKCLSVTNTATGDKETVRIVDKCGGTGDLELDLETAFNPIDSNGDGIAQGHLVVDYEFVDCDAAPAPPPGASDTNVTAYWTDYNVTENNWDMYAKPVACAEEDGNRSLEWRSKYGWTAFCGKNGPQGEEACGLCLNVTNTATNASEIVRIVDTCGSEGLDLDLNTAFHPIDTDGEGFRQGHLTVDYEFVDCGDSSLQNKLEKENTHLVHSQ